MMKKKCELCNSRARIYCESDQATLCWSCDTKVHTANFIVARHSRTLLCHSCNSLTHWTASGSDLGRAFCVCQSCLQNNTDNNMHHDAQSELNHQHDEEDEGNNQVVPWTTSAPAPSSSTTTTSDDDDDDCAQLHAKRLRRNVSDLASQCDTRQTSEGEDSVTGTRKKLKLKKQCRIQCSVEEDNSRSGAVDLNL